MLFDYKTMLCAIDCDETSIAALGHAKSLAFRLDAALHVLHVVPLTQTVGELVHRSEPGSDAPAYGGLQEVSDRELVGIKHELHIRFAYASEIAKSIPQTAGELHADLLVAATQGRSGVSRLLFGSVAELGSIFLPHS